MPQTLNISGYIKKKKVIILIGLGNNHNLINERLAEHLDCFVYPVKFFKVLVANEGSIDCEGKIHNIKLSIKEYNLSTPCMSLLLEE